MGFKGDLRNIGLSDVFQNIASNRLGGTLRIFDESSELYIYFSQGQVAMASRGKTARPVTDLLLRAGKITDRDHDRLIKRKAKSPKALPDLLGEMKLIKADEFRATVRRHMEEEIYEVFAWKSAQFEFTEGEPIPEVFDPDLQTAGLNIQSTSIIMEAARRLDEWEKIRKRIPTFREIVCPTSPIQAGGDGESGEVGSKVLEAADGRQSVQALIDTIPYTKFEICKAISDLLEGGMLRTLSEFERARLAETLATAGKHEEALEIFRLSLEVDRSDHDMRRKYASLLEKLGQTEDASSEVKILAHMLLEGGNREGALGAYQWAVGLSPSDTVAHEKLYALRKERGEKAEVIQAGQELAQLYRKVGLTEKARDLYLELVETRGEDPDVEELLAKTYLELGETRSAAARYRSAARLHLVSRNYNEAAEIYEQILKIDPDNPEAQKLIVEIREGRIALRKERLRRAGTVLLLSAGAIAFLAGLIYEGIARHTFHGAHLEEVRLLRNGNVAGAIEGYKAARRKFPYSISSLEARSVIARLASWQIEIAKTKEEIDELQLKTLPDEIKERGMKRRGYLEIHEYLAGYGPELRGDIREARQESISSIHDPAAAEAILQVHREIRKETWAPEINAALLKALEKINARDQILPVLIAWLDEVDQDYGGEPNLQKRDRIEIRGILSRLTGDRKALTSEDALHARYWRESR